MIWDKDTAKITAKKLLDIQAVKLEPDEPFIWASGLYSPIYCDNRMVLSYPEIRDYITGKMTELISTRYREAEVIAGVATGAIAWGVLVAQMLDLPFVYVRPKPKAHGRQNRVEGLLPPSSKVVVVEDLISTGMSSMEAIRALREEQANVMGMVAIFSYGFEKASSLFQSERVSLYTLSDYESLLKQALSDNTISGRELATLQKWRRQPENWGK
jgi:orotate phosphoribosyltransferase